MMPLIISRCCMNHICRLCLLRPERSLIALKSKCSRLQRAERLSPGRSLQQWSDFAPGGHKLDDLLTSPSRTCALGLSGAAAQDRVGGLCEEAVRRTKGRAGLSVALHTPCRHLEPSPDRAQRAARHLQGQGLPDRGTGPVHSDDARRRRVHPTFPHPRPAQGFHRIRHYGLLARPSCADNIARARELLAVPTPQHHNADADAVNPNDPPSPSHPCPCCGGRMITIEIFERGSTPRHRPTAPVTAIRIDTS